MQSLPHARLHPLVQAVPQRHAAATHLQREVFPRDAGLEHEDDPAQANPVGRARLAALGAGRVLGKNRFDQLPQLVGHQQLAHHVLHDNDTDYHEQDNELWERLFLEALS